jgi:hypothetical protein
MTGWVIQACSQNPKCVTSTTRRTMTHNPNAAHGTCTAEAMAIERNAASTLKNMGQKHSKATCMMHASQSVFEL